MRHRGRNLEDFFAAVVRHCVDTSYTNDYAAKLLVRIALEIFANEEYIDADPCLEEAEG